MIISKGMLKSFNFGTFDISSMLNFNLSLVFSIFHPKTPISAH